VFSSLISLVALSTLVADLSGQPAWRTDYEAALVQGVSQKRPLAIFLAPGKEGWGKLAAEGQLSQEVQLLLKAKYVAVYLNTETAQGKALATFFELPGKIGLVLSDREGQHQAFWHEGAFGDGELARALQRHADPEGPVLTTETNLDVRTSNYGAVSSPASAAPVYADPTYRYQPAYSPSCSH
jgi:hypothetical protein